MQTSAIDQADVTELDVFPEDMDDIPAEPTSIGAADSLEVPDDVKMFDRGLSRAGISREPTAREEDYAAPAGHVVVPMSGDALRYAGRLAMSGVPELDDIPPDVSSRDLEVRGTRKTQGAFFSSGAGARPEDLVGGDDGLPDDEPAFDVINAPQLRTPSLGDMNVSREAGGSARWIFGVPYFDLAADDDVADDAPTSSSTSDSSSPPTPRVLSVSSPRASSSCRHSEDDLAANFGNFGDSSSDDDWHSPECVTTPRARPALRQEGSPEKVQHPVHVPQPDTVEKNQIYTHAPRPSGELPQDPLVLVARLQALYRESHRLRALNEACTGEEEFEQLRLLLDALDDQACHLHASLRDLAEHVHALALDILPADVVANNDAGIEALGGEARLHPGALASGPEATLDTVQEGSPDKVLAADVVANNDAGIEALGGDARPHPGAQPPAGGLYAPVMQLVHMPSEREAKWASKEAMRHQRRIDRAFRRTNHRHPAL